MYKYLSDVNKIVEKMFSLYSFKEKSLIFYRGRINSFFEDYMSMKINENKPLDAITYFDIDTYLHNLTCAESERLNRYNALKRFFEYTYLKGITNEIISNVQKPTFIKQQKEVLTTDNYNKLKQFITDRENDIYERLILGLFIFTGLSRQYIAALRNNDFIFENGAYRLRIWKDDNEVILPLKSELQLIINEYCLNLDVDKKLDKLIEIDENYLSSYITTLTKTILNQKCNPTILSNTFISLALSSGNCIWEISKLTLESISTIEKHIKETQNLSYRQTSILNSF